MKSLPSRDSFALWCPVTLKWDQFTLSDEMMAELPYDVEPVAADVESDKSREEKDMASV